MTKKPDTKGNIEQTFGEEVNRVAYAMMSKGTHWLDRITLKYRFNDWLLIASARNEEEAISTFVSGKDPVSCLRKFTRFWWKDELKWRRDEWATKRIVDEKQNEQ